MPPSSAARNGRVRSFAESEAPFFHSSLRLRRQVARNNGRTFRAIFRRLPAARAGIDAP